jgi:hypothetical protein
MANKRSTELYRLNDSLLFREDDNGRMHFHCANHPELELVEKRASVGVGMEWHCLLCKAVARIDGFRDEPRDFLVKQAKSLMNLEQFKNAKLIRLDDYYVPEIRLDIKGEKTVITNRTELPSEYHITCDVKKDRDGDTMVMLQIFKSGDQKGAQFFIKPEKKQLTSDHNNPDPAKVISKIEVTLNDRKISHSYDTKARQGNNLDRESLVYSGNSDSVVIE